MFSQSSKLESVSLLFAIALVVLAATASSINAQQPAAGSLRGKVVDPAGALVGGASLTIVDASGSERKVQTNREGAFVINNLAADKYILRASAEGFAPYESSEITVSAGKATTLEIALGVTVSEEVTVDREQPVNTAPDANASATVLRESDIEALPDNSQELAAALQALAGPAAGPSGGEVFIDGFSGGRLPPRDTIREIRINQNPFSSEYDRLGFGRIEIFTKPGTDKFLGEASFEFEDESLNSRNPFARNRAPFQVRTVGGDFSGPIVKSRASFLVDVEQEDADNNSLINALILDPALNIMSLLPTINQLAAFAQPQTTRVVSPDLHAPFTRQTAIGIERQLPLKTTLSVTYQSTGSERIWFWRWRQSSERQSPY